ncbi:MAG: TRAP transporter large permease [Clostridiales Family XIII bacterium]|jgi:tripartite ATP-independent transporter DctM subunit|nr:TRAP transporter large permease [Clostridiales Family XIII bacterium]
MDPVLISIVGIIAFIVLLALGMQIGVSLALVGFIGFGICKGFPAAFGVLKTMPYTTAASFSLSVIPLFVFMGQLAYYSGISGELYDTCYKWLGRFRGGLGVSTLAACAMFSAICGSATATTATMGTVCLPEMSKYSYKRSLSTGLISAGGTMGILIPPSVGFIVYGTISGESIGAMFAAGILPGLLLTLLFIATVAVITARDPAAGPAGERFGLVERLRSLKGVIAFLILFVLVLGGIFGGLITPSEGGAVGAFGSLVFLAIRRKASLSNLFMALSDSIKTTAMIFTIMIGAYIFGNFLTVSRMPMKMAEAAVSMNLSPLAVLAMMLAVFIVLGCFVDALPLTIILVPIFLPIVQALEMNAIWFGVLMVLCMQIGLITPPVGMCCYVMAGVAKDVPLQSIFRGVLPFMLALVVALCTVIAFPAFATLLPGIFYGSQ